MEVQQAENLDERERVEGPENAPGTSKDLVPIPSVSGPSRKKFKPNPVCYGVELAKKPVLDVDDINCPICFSILYEPVTLPCKHSLCMGCLRKHLDETSIYCPCCRRRLSIWSRKNRNDLLDKELWDRIQNEFTDEVEARKNETDNDALSVNYCSKKPFFRDGVICTDPGVILEELKSIIKPHEEDLLNQRLQQEAASIKYIMELKEAEKKAATEKALKEQEDFHAALEMQKEFDEEIQLLKLIPPRITRSKIKVEKDSSTCCSNTLTSISQDKKTMCDNGIPRKSMKGKMSSMVNFGKSARVDQENGLLVGKYIGPVNKQTSGTFCESKPSTSTASKSSSNSNGIVYLETSPCGSVKGNEDVATATINHVIQEVMNELVNTIAVTIKQTTLSENVEALTPKITIIPGVIAVPEMVKNNFKVAPEKFTKPDTVVSTKEAVLEKLHLPNKYTLPENNVTNEAATSTFHSVVMPKTTDELSTVNKNHPEGAPLDIDFIDTEYLRQLACEVTATPSDEIKLDPDYEIIFSSDDEYYDDESTTQYSFEAKSEPALDYTELDKDTKALRKLIANWIQVRKDRELAEKIQRDLNLGINESRGKHSRNKYSIRAWTKKPE